RGHPGADPGPGPAGGGRLPAVRKAARGFARSRERPVGHFFSPGFLASPNRLRNRSIWPVESTSFILPVKNGCDALEMSSRTSGYSLPSCHLIVWLVLTVDRVRNEKLAAA